MAYLFREAQLFVVPHQEERHGYSTGKARLQHTQNARIPPSRPQQVHDNRWRELEEGQVVQQLHRRAILRHPSALHITLGVFGRLFDLLEESCHSLDLQLAHLAHSGPVLEPYQKYTELVQSITSLKEKASREHHKSLVTIQ